MDTSLVAEGRLPWLNKVNYLLTSLLEWYDGVNWKFKILNYDIQK